MISLLIITLNTGSIITKDLYEKSPDINKSNVSNNRVLIFEELLDNLTTQSLTTAEKNTLIETFLTEQESYGFPVTENTSVYFIYYDSATFVSVAGDFNGWTPNYDILAQVSGTNLFYLKMTFEEDARLDYKFVVGGSNWILDPRNTRTVSGGFGPNSELVMPDYNDDGSYLFSNPGFQGSLVTLNNFVSQAENDKTRTVTIYLPPNYDPSGETRYPTFYTSDGSEYLGLGYARNVLDFLIFNNLTEPLIGVFVNPINIGWRMEEYANTDCNLIGKEGVCRQNYAKFIATELVPYIDTNYSTINSSTKRAHIGDSLGGIISTYVASQYPDVIKLVGSHSGAFWVDSNVHQFFDTISKIDGMRFYLNAGTYEESIMYPTIEFAQILKNKHYPGKLRVFHQGHSWGQWRSTLSEMLMFLFTDEPSDYYGSPALTSSPDSISIPTIITATVINTLTNTTTETITTTIFNSSIVTKTIVDISIINKTVVETTTDTTTETSNVNAAFITSLLSIVIIYIYQTKKN
jgi:enterochelin esterase family protein